MFTYNDTAQAKLDKLDAMLGRSFTSGQDAALFAELLSLPNDGRHPTLELTPQQRRQKTLEALTTQLELMARSNPVLMIFEDAHWLDPTSLEVLGRTIDRLKTLQVLLLSRTDRNSSRRGVKGNQETSPRSISTALVSAKSLQ